MSNWDIAGLFQGDLIIKLALELILDDVRKNPWLIEDIFSSLLDHPILKQKYGIKEIHRAKEFILNNEIPVFMSKRMDKDKFPCITVTIGQSDEIESEATLGDMSVMTEDYNPSHIGKTISYIIAPFTIISYDKENGIVEIPSDIDEFRYISAGMIAIEPDTGNGYVIQERLSNNRFKINANSDIQGDKLAIIPQYHLYRARRERSAFREVYHIGCHVHGDPSTLIFLYSVIKYGLLRYKESLLEYSNFQISKISATDIVKNNMFDQSTQSENVYSRFIILTGLTEESWVKTPHRFIESIDLSSTGSTLTVENIKINNGLIDTDSEAGAGIKALAQDAPEEIQEQNDIWTTVDDE